ncbi:serine/threonine protein phosphatase [Frankia sp. EI5c]|uniref:PP2C family protein-serine/threonine phosphatase n=1 Tax=Frankia sp. EI5c TaxID=683316 RepID=UPI0007C2ECCF|nr:PP2C family serine/threonine-protein phosphatase [Frankia sp. EI5c]OAA20610.1 serine/threonine protein phosphatase [Frankia sp. EI5c]
MGSSLVPIMLIVVLLVGAVVFVALSSRAPRTGAESGRRRTLDTRRARPEAIPLRDAPESEPPDGVVPGFQPQTGAPIPAPAPAAPGGTEPAGGTDATGGVDPPGAGAWGGASGWSEWGDWDDAEATRVGSLSEPVADARGAGATTAPGDPVDTTTSPTGGGDLAGHNIGGTGDMDVSGLDSGSRDTFMNDSRDPDATGWTPPPSGRPHQAEVDDSIYRLATDGQGRSPSGYTGPASYPDPAAGETRRVDFGAEQESPWNTEPSTVPPAAPPAHSPESGAAGIVAAEPVHTTTPALRLAAAGRSRRGKRGGPNEDAWVVSDGLLAVADGVGGEAAGQIASTLSVTTVAGFRPQYAADPADGLRQAVARANQVVREKPREEPAWRGMACTLDVVILGRQQATGETLFIAHVGDSSVWLQPQKGRPRQVTTPHAIRNGPLLNAVGLADHIEADILYEPVRAGDRVILASDGITKVMTPEQLLGLMTELGAEPPERAADALVEAALLAGARDDTTIVVADLVSEPSAR